jgi:hypothetical protein
MVILALASVHCGTAATIYRSHDAPIRDVIVGSDRDAIYLEHDRDDPVDRKSIDHIDHPGTGAIITGAILTGVGLLYVASGAAVCSEEGVQCSAPVVASILAPLAVGLGLSIFGIAVRRSSMGAAGEKP